MTGAWVRAVCLCEFGIASVVLGGDGLSLAVLLPFTMVVLYVSRRMDERAGEELERDLAMELIETVFKARRRAGPERGMLSSPEDDLAGAVNIVDRRGVASKVDAC